MTQIADFDTTEEFALSMDDRDELAPWRDRFHLPRSADGEPLIYFCGNSLGLQPKATRDRLELHLDMWAREGVKGHTLGREAWAPYHELLREPLARLVGARPHEVVAMNSLTVNLHLLMVSFYRPEGERRAIVIDGPCFPSDVHAVKSQIRFHGGDPERDLLWFKPRDGERTIRTDDAVSFIESNADRIALVLIAGVNYATGQRHDVPAIADAARRAGAHVGVDAAHAAGNVPLSLHDWGVDFGAWCTYKYLNSGPGAVAGAFIHERHLARDNADALERFTRMPRFEGWWGTEPATRFQMAPEFTPEGSADTWQLSNPPIFGLAPVLTSVEMFDQVGMATLRAKSERLTGYLDRMLGHVVGDRVTVITPGDAAARGAQLSISTGAGARTLFDRLGAAGVVCDFREPDIIRVAPTPMYNTFHEVWRFVHVLRDASAG